MKKKKACAYNELDRRLSTYVVNHADAIQIDQGAKNRIWHNLHHEIHERNMVKKYKKRRIYRLAFVCSLVIVLLVSVDLTSDASLFKRLLIDISGNTITFYERGVHLEEESYQNENMDRQIEELAELYGKEYVSTAIPNAYDFVKATADIGILRIDLKHKDSEDRIKIIQKDVAEGSGTTATFNDSIFNIKSMKRNGIELVILESKQLNICLFTKENIEFEISSNVYQDMLNQVDLFSNQ
ncbi:hypothetical protein HZI73_23085 [Vallitalea pronyensis]|uniref:DUF4367 domain-containing protein n=1 Tax=Vallitalea pronyensis TaxID=1348613 RepID=A0A8J8MP06_9FIRM|nr:hypothetical protein [Vallitalea pronyensis]QUI24999.1 hypothetical protein HZI73_23085 [Vallitalea pronyensis]